MRLYTGNRRGTNECRGFFLPLPLIHCLWKGIFEGLKGSFAHNQWHISCDFTKKDTFFLLIRVCFLKKTYSEVGKLNQNQVT